MKTNVGTITWICAEGLQKKIWICSMSQAEHESAMPLLWEHFSQKSKLLVARNAAIALAALACRSPGIILLLCAVPETRVKLLWLVWGTELQGKRWGDWVDLTWGCLPWRRLPGGAIIGFKREICSLYSWCKKLKFNQVSGTRKSQVVSLGRFGLDCLRSHGVCLPAFNNRQVRSVRFMVSLVPFHCFLWITVDVTALLNHCLSVNESYPLAVLGVSYAS